MCRVGALASEQFLTEKMSLCAPTVGLPSSWCRIFSWSFSLLLISILITFIILMQVTRCGRPMPGFSLLTYALRVSERHLFK